MVSPWVSFLCGKSGIAGPFEARAPALRYVEGRGEEGRYRPFWRASRTTFR